MSERGRGVGWCRKSVSAVRVRCSVLSVQSAVRAVSALRQQCVKTRQNADDRQRHARAHEWGGTPSRVGRAEQSRAEQSRAEQKSALSRSLSLGLPTAEHSTALRSTAHTPLE